MKLRLIRTLALFLALCLLLGAAAFAVEEEGSTEPTETVTEATEPSEEPTEPSEEPTEPKDEYEYPDDWSREALVFAVENGILNGDQHHNLNPHKSITRAEMAAILVRMLGASTTGNLAAYHDVSTGDWFYTELSAAVAAGIFNGVTENSMQPNAPLTREQAVVVLTRAFGIADMDRTAYTRFADSDSIAPYARDAVSAMTRQNGISGYTDGTFRPQNEITRAEVAQLIRNMFTCIADTPEELPAEGRVLYRGAAALPEELTLDGSLILGQAAPAEVRPTAWKITDLLVVRTGKDTVVDTAGITVGSLVIAPLSGTASANHPRVFLGGKLEFTGETTYLTVLNGTVKATGSCGELSVRDGAALTLDGGVDGDVVLGDNAGLKLTGSCKNLTLGKKSEATVDGNTGVVNVGKNAVLHVKGTAAAFYFDQEAAVTLDGDIDYLCIDKDYVHMTVNGQVRYIDVPGVDVILDGTGKAGTITLTGGGAQVSLACDLLNDFATIKTCKIPCYSEYDVPLYAYNGGGGYICTIPAGTVVYNEYWPSGNWMKVSMEDGTRGWVNRYNFFIDVDNADYDGTYDYSDGAKENFVNRKGYESKTEYLLWINRYTQKVIFFRGSKGNWKVFKTAPCASGSNYTPTPEGVYAVYAKQDKWDWGGYGVLDVTLFSGEMAFHSYLVGWGGYVVDGTMSQPASHGCIRMLPEDAEYIHDNIPVDTTVVVY